MRTLLSPYPLSNKMLHIRRAVVERDMKVEYFPIMTVNYECRKKDEQLAVAVVGIWDRPDIEDLTKVADFTPHNLNMIAEWHAFGAIGDWRGWTVGFDLYAYWPFQVAFGVRFRWDDREHQTFLHIARNDKRFLLRIAAIDDDKLRLLPTPLTVPIDLYVTERVTNWTQSARPQRPTHILGQTLPMSDEELTR